MDSSSDKCRPDIEVKNGRTLRISLSWKEWLIIVIAIDVALAIIGGGTILEAVKYLSP